MTQEDATTEPDKINLREFLDSDEPLTLSEAVALSKKAIRCLVDLHSNGRTLKFLDPERIYVHSNGTLSIEPSASLSEFKIDEAGQTTLPIDFLAPEIIEKSLSDVSSDIYSIAALTYHLVTGSIPGKGETVNQTVKNILKGSFTPVSKLSSDCPQVLNDAIMKSLAKDPSTRHKSALEFLKIVDQF